MPSGKSNRRCICSFRGCCNYKDEGTGQLGVELGPREYLRHQIDDKRVSNTNAMKAQAAAITNQHATIEEALSGLSIGQHPAEVSNRQTQQAYRIDRVKDMIGLYAIILQDILKQENTLRELAEFPPGRQKLDAVHDALRKCRDAQTFVVKTEMESLRPITRGPLRKDPSVEAQRLDCLIKLQTLEVHISDVEPFWKSRLEEHNTEFYAAQELACKLYDTTYHFSPIMKDAWIVIQLIVFMIVVGHIILGYSRRGCTWLFSMSDYILQTTVQQVTKEVPKFVRDILARFPRDIRAATEKLRLEGKSTVYAACPKCDKIYPPKYNDGIPTYPEKCNYHRYRSRCKALLVRPERFGQTSRNIGVPIKPFVSFDFTDWLASMASREGIEEKMDAAWSRMSPSPDGNINDIFQAPYVYEFTGRDGKHFSESGNETTGRYLFSLGFDFFNPFRNLAAGKKVSVGVIALACLNLPIDLRYKPENMFLAGVIPGPKEPSLDAGNPYFRPIVNEFLDLWEGVYLSRTTKYPEIGRLILCALILLICDLPAARKAGGFVACTHDLFCSLCWCSRTVHSFNDFNYRSWKLRTGDECRTHAEHYLKAPTFRDARRFSDKTGLRSSEFLRLPYFDLTKNLVVDPMHNLFLGLIKEHFQNIIGCVPPKKERNTHDDEDDEDMDGIEERDIPAPLDHTRATAPMDALHSGSPSTRASPLTNTPTIGRTALLIRPTVGNPLPENKNGRSSVRKLTDWLEESDKLEHSPLEVDALVKRWSQPNITINGLVYVGKAVGCFPTTMTENGRDNAKPEEKRNRKAALARVLVEWHCQRLVTMAAAPAISIKTRTPTSSLFRKQGKILTEVDMKELRRDIESIVKPSWVTSIPLSISSSGPKLKSDQWRTAGTLYLPITLIRLWSKPGDDDASRERRELLHLTMLLFSAISIATSRVTSNSHADQYMSHMIKYREELQRIFPKYRCHPNHHMALHQGDFIRKLGPVHGWWTFPFERMIGQLQRIPMNYKAGEYEETIARTWFRRANLKALLSKVTCPPIIQACEAMYTELIRLLDRNSLAIVSEEPEAIRGVSISGALVDNVAEGPLTDTEELMLSESVDNYDRTKEKPMSADVIRAFQNRGILGLIRAVAMTRVRQREVSYTSQRIHEGNSGVLIHSNGSDVPFCIQEFIKLPHKVEGSGLWIVARQHRAAQVEIDPYAAYPYLRAKMWNADLERELEVFPFSAIQGQYAKCVVPWMGSKVAVCVSLSRIHAIL